MQLQHELAFHQLEQNHLTAEYNQTKTLKEQCEVYNHGMNVYHDSLKNKMKSFVETVYIFFT